MTTTRRTVRAAWLLVALAGAGIVACAAAASALAAPVKGDFDGDGFGDLAVGAPADSVQGQGAAGAVNVLYGTDEGLRERRDQQFTRGMPRLGVAQAGARFGAALAAGDLDGDGYADLAIGAPGEDAGGLTDAPASGVVSVLYGSSGGLRTRAGATTFSQNSVGVAGNAESGDQFGAALAIGDLDGDGRGDLAVGAPGDSVGGAANAGAVTVLYGRAQGLGTARSQLWTQNTRGVKGLAGANHRFGAALAAGDLSRNGRDELAIGIPGGVIAGGRRAGAVSVLYGRDTGLSSIDDLWSQDARGIKGVASADDRFGASLAIGDFDDDGAGDLAVGSSTESVSGAFGAGAVNVLRGSRTGLRERGDQLWTQDSPDVRTRASIGEAFGTSLAAADFSRNGVDDLAIGVPGEEVAGVATAGAVAVLYGAADVGLRARDNQLWHQGISGVPGRLEMGDRFGASLAAGDFDGDDVAELAVGTPNDSVDGVSAAGAVNVLRGSSLGLRGNALGLWTQARSGVRGALGQDRFGEALAAGHG